MTDVPGSLLSTRIETSRLTMNVLHTERRSGTPVICVHGNLSSSVFFGPTLQALPEGWRPYAVDLRGFGATDPLPIDATKGMRDWAEDLAATIDALELPAVHLVGWSMGGGVVLQVLLDRPELVASLTLIAPVSPYGYGGTTDAVGTPIDVEGSCSGAGGANPDFVRHLAEGDRSDGPMSPRTILRNFYFAPAWPGDDEELVLDSMLTTRVGDDHYPGDVRPDGAWPGFLPGGRGVLNTMAPNHFDVSGIVESESKPPILWIRGELDLVVSDQSMFDLAQLGALGAIPGWPGPDTHPPQPMVAQTRQVLQNYAERGGSFREVVMPEVGHSPHVERPVEFLVALREHLDSIGG